MVTTYLSQFGRYRHVKSVPISNHCARISEIPELKLTTDCDCTNLSFDNFSLPELTSPKPSARVAPDVREKMVALLALEYEFFNWIKGRLDHQKGTAIRGLKQRHHVVAQARMAAAGIVPPQREAL